MPDNSKLPKRLYKYRGFSHRVLDMLVADELYYANPADFNDPLDSRPSVEPDLDVYALEQLLKRLFEQRTQAEMAAAATAIKYKGPRTIEHIARLCRSQAINLLSEIRYNADDPFNDMDDPHRFILAKYLEDELLRRYDRGIVSFGARATCPLMWSHYGDQHRGICAGYSTPPDVAEQLHKMVYGGSRSVKASDVAAMNDDEGARRRVDRAVLLRKAGSWRYELEWRLFGPHGSNPSPLELEEVLFGIRCKSTVKYAIVKALEKRGRQIDFYEMIEVPGTFKLKKSALCIGQLSASLPRRARAVFEEFEPIDDNLIEELSS